MTPEQKYSIDYQGLTSEMHHFRFEVSDDIFSLWDESEVKKGSFVAEIDMKKSGSVMELAVQIIGEAELTCDRCLESFRMPVKYDGNLTVKISEQEGEYDGDIMWIHPSETKLSLAQYIYESIILSLPYQRVHARVEDCNPEMLRRFKIIGKEEYDSIVEVEESQNLGNIEGAEKLEALKRSMKE